MKNKDYEKLIELNLDLSEINFEQSDYSEPYFCTPVKADILGWEGCIHYCFIHGFGERVFAVNPESCVDYNVYPVAENFRDFLTLIVSTGSRNPVEQIINFSAFEDFKAFVSGEKQWFDRPEHIQVTEKIKGEFSVQSMDLSQVYNHVKKLQADFDYDKINFTDEYYELTGRQKPDGSFVDNINAVEFEAVTFVLGKDKL